MRYLHFIALSAIFTAMGAMCGCSKQQSGDNERPILLVSIDPQQKMLQELAGDNYQVVTMLASGANPESYEPTMRQSQQANSALAYFTLGMMPFEQTLQKTLKDNVAIVDAAQGIATIRGSHSHDHHGHRAATHSDGHEDDVDEALEPDPHVWTSFANAKIIARNMANGLKQLSPQEADSIEGRLVAMLQRIDSLDASAAAKLRESGAHAFAVWHPSLSYYAKDYGLHQLSVGLESKEISPNTLKAIIDEARADSVRVFFFQREYDSRQAQSINKEIGARLVTINPLAYDWEAELMKITDELSRQ